MYVNVSAYIELDPHRPGPANARLRDSGVPVWALVGYLQAVDGDIQVVADDYVLPREAVLAAVVYYVQHQSAIDARLDENASTTL